MTIPVYNEQAVLRRNISRLHAFLTENLVFKWNIVIVNNGSTDQTLEISRALQKELSHIQVLYLNQKGRGRALKQAWLQDNAEILSYMDADLSTELEAFPVLIDALLHGEYQLAVGSRLLKTELTQRCLKREMASRCYNYLIKAVLGTQFSDAQCGFKAITRQAAQALLPAIQDDDWFFDTELLVAAEKSGYHILDLPVRWVERQDSHVNICQTVIDDLKGLIRLRRSFTR